MLEFFKARQRTLLTRLKREPALDLDTVQSDRERVLAGRLALYTHPGVMECKSTDAVKWQLKQRADVARIFIDAVPRPFSCPSVCARVHNAAQFERGVLSECRALIRWLRWKERKSA